MDSRIEGTDRMGSASSKTRAVRSVDLDRPGRILIALGSLVAVVLVALPILGFALFMLSFANVGEGPFSCHTSDCAEAFLWDGLLAIAVVVAVIVTIVMMLRGGTVSLMLGGFGSFIVGTVALVFLLQGDSGVWVLGVLTAMVAPGAFALVFGAAFRLIARRRA